MPLSPPILILTDLSVAYYKNCIYNNLLFKLWPSVLTLTFCIIPVKKIKENLTNKKFGVFQSSAHELDKFIELPQSVKSWRKPYRMLKRD